ncbi:MAG: YccF domain-containing protein [Roseiflexaceae bacterium]|nr:YccF domain-containing protein [Roseiflexaceae bacterium]
MTTNTIVIPQKHGPGILVRAIYFIFFGLWFSGIWAAIAWFLCVIIIGLPFGLWMLNRLPQVATLKQQRSDLVITSSGKSYNVETRQQPFLLRAIYFVLIGWWLSALWITAAWALCASVIGLLPGFWMMNRVPAVITLARA